jgi:hypothetical protein
MSVPANAIPKALHWWWRCATGVAIVAAIVSAALAIRCKTWLPGKYVVAFGWALVPPAWFIFERQVLIRKYGEPVGYRDNADLAFKFWAGVAALLIFLYT